MRTAVVTGGNRGIGHAVCEALRDKGFRTVAVCRGDGAPPGVEVVRGDLANRRTVGELVTSLRSTCESIDVLVHNAGVWPTRLRHNDDGIEESFAVNHLAPFQLNLGLEDRVRRVVQVSAGLQGKGRVDLDRTPYGEDFHRMRTYCDTKRANLLLVPLFARRWQDAGVTIDAVHPGVIRTGLGDPGGVLGVVLRLVKRRWASPGDGAAPIVRLVDDDTGTGRYFVEYTEDALPDGPSEELWDQARELTGAG
jgi:NAD(P)-dependent dehydrogenase (short-subunit alcohol dehydrogenase family)